MKIAILYGPSDLRMEEQPLDSSNLEPDEVWVRTQITGFKIGTDRGNFEGAEQVPGAPDYPRWVGDSNLGIVEGVGSGVEDFQVGDTVLSSMHHQSEYVVKVTPDLVKVPDGVLAWPRSSAPQQAGSPSLPSAQLCMWPALTATKVPAGGVAWPWSSAPQQWMAPSRWTAQV